MKNTGLSVLLLSCLLLPYACKKDLQLPGTRLNDDEDAVLALEDCVKFSEFDLTVCLTGISEGRCPCNAMCFFEGSVDFTFQVYGKGVDTTVTLQTNSFPEKLPHSITLGKTTLDIADQTEDLCSNYGNYDRYKVQVTLSK